jgi:hypothetical protein
MIELRTALRSIDFWLCGSYCLFWLRSYCQPVPFRAGLSPGPQKAISRKIKTLVCGNSKNRRPPERQTNRCMKIACTHTVGSYSDERIPSGVLLVKAGPLTMSALGQKRTWPHVRSMSALPQKRTWPCRTRPGENGPPSPSGRRRGTG